MLDDYDAMVRVTRQMLEAARLSDWALLIELGQQREAIEVQLHALQDGVPAAPADGEPEQQLVAALLAANGQIQTLVETHLASLQAQAGGGAAGALS